MGLKRGSDFLGYSLSYLFMCSPFWSLSSCYWPVIPACFLSTSLSCEWLPSQYLACYWEIYQAIMSFDNTLLPVLMHVCDHLCCLDSPLLQISVSQNSQLVMARSFVMQMSSPVYLVACPYWVRLASML